MYNLSGVLAIWRSGRKPGGQLDNFVTFFEIFVARWIEMVGKLATGNSFITKDMSDDRSQTLVRLLTQHHPALLRYIHALVGNVDDANDVLQETSVALFQKFDQFDEGRPFLAWAYRFAYLEVLKWRKRSSKIPLALDSDVVELLAHDRERRSDLLMQRTLALPDCFGLVPRRDLIAIRSRYFDHISVEELSEVMGLSRRTLFRELQRIRNVLMNCIDSKLAAEEV